MQLQSATSRSQGERGVMRISKRREAITGFDPGGKLIRGQIHGRQ